MANDFKIKFEYKGIGKQAFGARQKAIQAQKGLEKKQGGASSSDARSTISALRTLNSSILKLIESNNKLARSMSGKGTGGGGGGSGLPIGGGSGQAFGGMGASIPILGAGIAALGFAITKINQIGKAYMEKTSQQLGNVGIGGFRYGKGVYDSAQMGAGMKAYGMATGKFSQNETPNAAALQMGAIYGLSAEETLRTAGQFARAGGNYEKAANIGAGMGIQSEIPTLLTGMANILTDAVREGVNTSDMSEDMAQNLSSIVMATPGKSVEAALNMVRSFQGVKSQVAGGKFGTTEALYATKASQQMLMEKLIGEGRAGYIESLKQQGFISEEQAQKMAQLNEGSTFEDLMAQAPSAAMPLLRKFTAEADATELQKRTMQNVQKSFGDTAEGRQRFYDFAATQGWSQSQSQLEALMNANWNAPAGIAETGADILAEKEKEVTGSVAGMNIQRIQKLENMMFAHGETFAEASMKMENAMLNIAAKAAPAVETSIEAVGDAMDSLSQSIGDLQKQFEAATDEQGNISLKKLFGFDFF